MPNEEHLPQVTVLSQTPFLNGALVAYFKASRLECMTINFSYLEMKYLVYIL